MAEERAPRAVIDPLGRRWGGMAVEQIGVGVAGVALAGAGLALGGPAAGLGVAIGAGLAALNLWLLTHIGRAMIRGARGGLWGLLGAVKLVGLLGGAWLLVRSGWTSPLSLALGYGALPLGLTAGAFLRPPETA